MGEKLFSTSNVAQGIYNRLTALEVAGSSYAPNSNPTFVGTLTAPTVALDANFTVQTNAGNPQLSFDTGGDTLTYARSTNIYSFAIGGAAQFSISPSGIFAANPVTFGDGNFAINLNSGAPTLQFDAGDYIQYNRITNTYAFNVGASSKASVSSGGIEALALVSDSYIAAATYVQVGDTNFGFRYDASLPYVAFDSSDTLQYVRASNTFAFNVGNVTQATIDGFGNVSATGGVYANGDAQFFLLKTGGNPILNFDSGDFIKYDRTANKFYFVIGGANVASIDASGNIRALGTITGSVTP